MVSALPGFNALTPVHDSQTTIEKRIETIVGNGIETRIEQGKVYRSSFLSRPITISVVDRHQVLYYWATEHPDGRCIEESGETYPSRAELLKHWQKRAEARAGWQAKPNQSPAASEDQVLDERW
jgi:hypothetical protein